MSKRAASELTNESKRPRTDANMPPPQSVQPRNASFTLKSQASVTDPKPNALLNDSDDDDDDEDLWYRASQIEERELKRMRGNQKPDFSYTDFKMSAQRPMTSTQATQLTSNNQNVDPKMRMLQNRCTALEKQLKKYRASSPELSQKASELSELKERIKRLARENNELKQQKFKNDVDVAVSRNNEKLKSENDELRQQIERLLREKREGSEKAQVTRSEGENFGRATRTSPRVEKKTRVDEWERNERFLAENARGSAQILSRKPIDAYKTPPHPMRQPKSLQGSEKPQKLDYKSAKKAVWKSDWDAPKFDTEIIEFVRKIKDLKIFYQEDPKVAAIPSKPPAKNIEITQKPASKPQTSPGPSRSLSRTLRVTSAKPASQESFATARDVSNSSQSTSSSSKDVQSPRRSSFACIRGEIDRFFEHPKDTPEIASLKLLVSRKALEIVEESKVDDTSEIFNEISVTFSKMLASVKEVERRRWNEHFMRQEFARKQAQHFSDQYFASRELKSFKKCRISDLVSPLPLFEDEMRVEERRRVAFVSVLCKNSHDLSERLLTQNISPNSGDFRVIVDDICDTIDPFILQSRFLQKNSGLALALSDLLCSISSHYGSFDRGNSAVDRKLMKLFHHLLAMATNDAQILLKLTQFLVNITHSRSFRIIAKFCTNFPSVNLEFSRIFRIYQIPRSGCALQIFFCLLMSSFRYNEDVSGARIEGLVELATTLNILVDNLLQNEMKLKFLEPQEGVDSKAYCKCYKFLTTAMLVINEQVLRHRSLIASSGLSKLQATMRSAVVNITNLLAISRGTVFFWRFYFCHNMMNEIYCKMSYGEVATDDRNKFYGCKELLLIEKDHDHFLKKLKLRTKFDDDDEAEEPSVVADEDLNSSKITRMRSVKQSLLKESAETFLDDESSELQSSFTTCLNSSR